ncbi:NADH dehydrogenase, alpha subcomplex, subunit 8 [Ascodesmis nigricans]|uniref:NADH-ubiquinone oxidoreductase n=1 Tax=Ascodesmis nigricans TaxID=341454 RepID=A0A4S2N2I8_9PEZI|nr:NADH dehydrogenase, alpha subcomplex, subunit 8 [Ascodesmis nigricans]
MSTNRQNPTFTHAVLVDRTPMPAHIPPVEEVGATSAPLTSAAFFIGDRCKKYNEDYMLCKHEARGRGELDCMLEGRRVTRCAASVITDINKHCLEAFRGHWKCMDNNNMRFSPCRAQEKVFNQCVFEKLGLQKHLPDTPKGEVPIHLKEKQTFA